jgi:hypothetical protein
MLGILAPMTPAEKRIKDLVNRWLVSLDLHLQYADLNDLAYNRVQNWPVHDRPNKAILEIAQQKAAELNTILVARHLAGDTKFAEAVELVNFLTNLVGSQYVQRFIPLAEAPKAPAAQTATPKPTPSPPTQAASQPSNRPTTPAVSNSTTVQTLPTGKPATPPVATIEATKPAVAQSTPTAAPASRPTSNKTSNTVPELDDSLILAARIDATRINNAAAAKREVTVPDIDVTREMPRPQRNPAAHKKQPAKSASPTQSKPDDSKRTSGNNSGSNIEQLIVADAVRLTNWGREWHELAEAIARIADRPSVGEIRKILRNHRDEIKRRAAEPQS